MAETALTKKIKLALYHHTKAHLQGMYGAFEVVMGKNTIGYGNEYVDFLTMNSDNEFRCYEIKVSKEDLYSNNNLSFYGDFNYLVVPDFLFQDALHFVLIKQESCRITNRVKKVQNRISLAVGNRNGKNFRLNNGLLTCII